MTEEIAESLSFFFFYNLLLFFFLSIFFSLSLSLASFIWCAIDVFD